MIELLCSYQFKINQNINFGHCKKRRKKFGSFFCADFYKALTIHLKKISRPTHANVQVLEEDLRIRTTHHNDDAKYMQIFVIS